MVNFYNFSFLLIIFSIFNAKPFASDVSIVTQEAPRLTKPLKSDKETDSFNTYPLLQTFLDGKINKLVVFFLK